MIGQPDDWKVNDDEKNEEKKDTEPDAIEMAFRRVEERWSSQIHDRILEQNLVHGPLVLPEIEAAIQEHASQEAEYEDSDVVPLDFTKMPGFGGWGQLMAVGVFPDFRNISMNCVYTCFVSILSNLRTDVVNSWSYVGGYKLNLFKLIFKKSIYCE